jgi:hypothetical protein
MIGDRLDDRGDLSGKPGRFICYGRGRDSKTARTPRPTRSELLARTGKRASRPHGSKLGAESPFAQTSSMVLLPDAAGPRRPPGRSHAAPQGADDQGRKGRRGAVLPPLPAELQDQRIARSFASRPCKVSGARHRVQLLGEGGQAPAPPAPQRRSEATSAVPARDPWLLGLEAL